MAEDEKAHLNSLGNLFEKIWMENPEMR
jgi:hypothetical protein